MASQEPKIRVEHLDMAYGSFTVMNDLNFEVNKGEVFIIMGGSGCGKSTLLKHLIGIKEPARGEIFYDGNNFTSADDDVKKEMLKGFGVTYQGGALWSSMTLAENVGLPLGEYTNLKPKEIREVASYKLSLVGLRGFEDFYPAEISGGMCKRAGLARAMALDPDVLFFDEPSAGLDPISSRLLDDLILELRDSLGATFVVVTHELASIFAIADRAIFLDAKTRYQLEVGNPVQMREHSEHETVRNFLMRGELLDASAATDIG
ncbi:ABC transporter ATP-binding protein [Cerasicoccus fimbriatus]|uniref:ABC transporter ATP-binding protein n=1 Tax=Cerasicoccus fimbriatus TaxID=3014554 RepID=UPI0022B3D9BB|nr:ATP-binding cassette domain-containing protein [Cerasicoccus sp. TK19100]